MRIPLAVVPHVEEPLSPDCRPDVPIDAGGRHMYVGGHLGRHRPHYQPMSGFLSANANGRNSRFMGPDQERNHEQQRFRPEFIPTLA